jgi:molecular chaperone HscB
MSDPFTVLGVPRRFRLDARLLEQRHRDLSRALHPDKHTQGSPAERRIAVEKAAAVNEAFRTLKNPQSRGAALLAGAGRVVDEASRADQALLLEILELREELESTRAAAADVRSAKVATMRAQVEARVNAAEAVIAEAFDRDAEPAESDAVDRAYRALIELRYLYRFLEEADAMLEE